MAIAYRAGTTQNGNSTNVTVNAPTGLTDGDLIIVSIGRGSTSITMTPPAGWSTAGTNTTNENLHVFYKIASGEGASWTFNGSGSNAWFAICDAYSGTHQTFPLDVTWIGNAGATAVTSYATTATARGTVNAWSYHVWTNDGAGAITLDAALTARSTANNGANRSIAAGDESHSGASGAGTSRTSSGGSGKWAACTFVIHSADAGVDLVWAAGDCQINGAGSSKVYSPTGIQDGDLLLLLVGHASNTGMSFPAGFTQYQSTQNGGSGEWGSIYYKIASSESGSYTLSWTNTSHVASGFFVYRNVDTSAPFAAWDANSTNNNDVVCNSLTPSQAADRLVCLYSKNSSITPTWITSQRKHYTLNGGNGLCGVFDECTNSTSATGTRTVTAGATQADVGLNVILKYASGSSGISTYLLSGLMASL